MEEYFPLRSTQRGIDLRIKRRGCSRQDPLGGSHLQCGAGGQGRGAKATTQVSTLLTPSLCRVIFNSAGLKKAPSYFSLSLFCEEWGEVYYIYLEKDFFFLT